MKYVVIVPDGMADHPCRELDGKTPMEAAKKETMDFLASNGTVGLVQTVPEGMVPESDTANLALLGYDPLIYSKGRSPLEALSMGLDMSENQTAVRVNLVALSDTGEPYGEKLMLDHSADEVTTGEADILINAIGEALPEGMKLYTGISYRHCLLWDNYPGFTDFSRPHDIIGQRIEQHLPYGAGLNIRRMMEKSFETLNNHPVNLDRKARGLKKANSIWLWSPGRKPVMPSFSEKTGLQGAVICAVDLIKGIGLCAGMDVPMIDGATGNLHTSYDGKCRTAIEKLEAGYDYVYIHIEAPDECGHRGEADNKVRSIELIDEKIVQPIMGYLNERGEDYRILITPDHPTPVEVRTHTREPIPFVLYSSGGRRDSKGIIFSEKEGKKSGLFFETGEALQRFFLA